MILSAEERAFLSRPGPWTRIQDPLSWTRQAFGPVDEDRWVEYLESLGETLPEPAEMRIELAPEFTQGRTVGDLLLLREMRRVRPCGVVHRFWVCRCSCGNEVIAEAYKLRRISRCKPCAAAMSAARRSLRFGRFTTVELARKAGVTRQAILMRVDAGWPIDRLGDAKIKTSGRRRAA